MVALGWRHKLGLSLGELRHMVIFVLNTFIPFLLSWVLWGSVKLWLIYIQWESILSKSVSAHGKTWSQNSATFPTETGSLQCLFLSAVGFWFLWPVEYDGSDILISKVKFLMPVSIVGYSMKEVSSLVISEAESLRSGSHIILALVRAYPSCLSAWLTLHEESLCRRERATPGYDWKEDIQGPELLPL